MPAVSCVQRSSWPRFPHRAPSSGGRQVDVSLMHMWTLKAKCSSVSPEPGAQPKDTDPQSLRDSILNRPKERREELVSATYLNE